MSSDSVSGASDARPESSGGPIRRLVILRHAAADYHFDGPDRERPLTQDGEHTALARGRQLGQKVPAVDRLLVSPAVRTRQTATMAMPDGPDPQIVESIYEATAGDLITVLERFGTGCTVLVGHNPGLSDLASLLTGRPQALAPGDALILSMTQPQEGPLQPLSAEVLENLTAV